MEQTFQALESILLKAIPTVIFLLLLHFYLKAMLFKPLAKVLKQREELTKGARQTAETSLARAEQKAQEYEAKLRDARNEVYKEQEEIRKKWLADQSTQLAQAKASSEARVKAAREAIAQDVAASKQGLAEQSAVLADQIAATVLARRSS